MKATKYEVEASELSSVTSFYSVNSTLEKVEDINPMRTAIEFSEDRLRFPDLCDDKTTPSLKQHIYSCKNDIDNSIASANRLKLNSDSIQKSSLVIDDLTSHNDSHNYDIFKEVLYSTHKKNLHLQSSSNSTTKTGFQKDQPYIGYPSTSFGKQDHFSSQISFEKKKGLQHCINICLRSIINTRRAVLNGDTLSVDDYLKLTADSKNRIQVFRQLFLLKGVQNETGVQGQEILRILKRLGE
jgi:hypothetical protein